MALKQRRKTWYYDIWHNGQRHRGSTGRTDKKEAQRVHDEVKAKLWSQPRVSGKSWNDAFLKWLDHKPRSESDCYCLRAMVYENRPLNQCTVESFTDILDEMDVSPSTYNRQINRIQAVLNLSGQHIRIPKKPSTEGRLRYLTGKEWDKLYAELPAHLKPMALFAVKTGLRRHNVTHLMWQDVDMPRSVLRVHADQAKGRRSLGIPLNADALAVLKAQQTAQNDAGAVWVFPYEGEPIVSVQTAFDKALLRSGLAHLNEAGKQVNDFTWHGLRHTWASWHIMNGTPLAVLKELGGWKDLTMVMRYAHLAPDAVAAYAGNATPQPTTPHKSATQKRNSKPSKGLQAA
jgi:integrase